MIKFNLIVSLLILPIMATDIAAQARFTPKELPYAYDALAPQVSEETLRFHHDKHYVGYVNKLNELILDTPYAQQPLEDIVVSADGAIFNNAAQMWNHEFFFDQLSPDGEARPTGALLKAIDADFGSFEQFKAQMEKAAVGLFGSGWAWLAEDKSGKLAIVTEQNAGNPMCHGMKPLMCFDVWEHAYYIDYRNRRADAVAALKKHYQKKPLLPKAFSAQNHIEQIQGVYVPFWLFSGSAEGDVTYKCTRSMTRREGDYDVTDTQHYLVRRAGSVTFEKIPVDASSKMPDENMDSIEPFDYQALKPFSNAYLPGFLADQYNVSVEQSASRADTRCKASCESALRSTVTGYTTCTPETQTVRIRRGQVQYALLPVWMLHTKWKGKDYLFSMNGQTGKLTGDLPISWGRFWAYFAGIAGGLAAVLSVLLFAL